MADDIVDLRIEAENLASEALVEAADDTIELGRQAEKTQRQVEQLEITRETLVSFEQAENRLRELTDETARADAEFKKLREELKNTENASDEQRESVSRQQQELKNLNSQLTVARREFNQYDASLRKAGVNTANFASEQQRVSEQLSITRTEATRLNNIYDQQASQLRENITAQKEIVSQTKEETAAQERLNDKLQEQRRNRQAAVEAARNEARANRELAETLQRYERELARLNDEKAEGNLTTGQYIRSEARLREQLRLTSSQVSTSRRAIEADIENKNRATRSTDALTSVTRRLAQAYTVLIAAQGAAQTALRSVDEFGKFETAITNIERTTGLAADQVVTLADQIVDLSKNVTPTATSELLRFAEVAGQLGVNSTADILNLVVAADQLGVATNIAGDEAATLLTRILQTTGEGVPQIQNLASSVVQLGNNFAATESEIVQFTRNIVTATRDINLSSAGAAALGTTLAVTGLQAESSRTAISRLAQVIRTAATEGGSALEDLANITGLTGEAIQENLGERSEETIFAFIEGLRRAREAGAATGDVIRRFGIDGFEAIQVFSSLSSRTETLRDAIDQSNEAFERSNDAFERSNAQAIEAARAYATQESAVGRLSNTYVALQKNIGEAFSDEVDAAIRQVTDGIEGLDQEIVDLFEILPDIIRGFDELVGVVDNLFSILGTDSSSVLTGVVEGFTVFFNSLTAGFNALILIAQNTQLVFAELGAEIAEFFGQEPNTQLLDTLRERVEQTKNDILRDSSDIQDSINRLSGTSTRRYEDLVEAADKYSESLSLLSKEQQNQIATAVEQNRSIEGQDQLYQDLTSAIVKANRQREIEITLTEENARIAAEAQAAATEEIANRERQIQLASRQIIATEEITDVTQRYGEQVENLKTSLDNGAISSEIYATTFNRLTEEYNSQISRIEQVNDLRVEEQRSTQAVLNEIENLILQYQKGAINADDYQRKLGILKVELNQVNSALVSNAQASGVTTREQAKLAVEINNSVEKIRDLEGELRNAIAAKQSTVEINARLRSEQEKLNGLRQEELRLNELSNASFSELNILRQQATQQLERLEQSFRAGTITAGEYLERQRELTSVISDFNSVLGENTDALEENIDAQRRSAQAQQSSIDITRERLQQNRTTVGAVSLLAQEQANLNREYDFSNASLSELSARSRELNSNIIRNTSVTSAWWRELARTSNEVFANERAVIGQERVLRRYLQTIESGSATLEDLNRASIATNVSLRDLGQNRLNVLRSAIADARREIQDLNGIIASAVEDSLDRLDRARGDEQAIINRRNAEERQELQRLIAEARRLGNESAARQAEQALRNLQTAQNLEAQQRRQQQNNDVNSNNSNNSNDVIDVRLTLPDGSTRAVQVSSAEDANALLDALSALGQVSNQGNN